MQNCQKNVGLATFPMELGQMCSLAKGKNTAITVNFIASTLRT